jgi:hypothetical protein
VRFELRPLNIRPGSSDCKYFLEEYNRLGGAFKVDMPQHYSPHRVPQGARWEIGDCHDGGKPSISTERLDL